MSFYIVSFTSSDSHALVVIAAPDSFGDFENWQRYQMTLTLRFAPADTASACAASPCPTIDERAYTCHTERTFPDVHQNSRTVFRFDDLTTEVVIITVYGRDLS